MSWNYIFAWKGCMRILVDMALIYSGMWRHFYGDDDGHWCDGESDPIKNRSLLFNLEDEYVFYF